jgi:hypothetical protein
MLRIWNRRLWYEVDARDGICSRRKARFLTAIFARIPDAANTRHRSLQELIVSRQHPAHHPGTAW